MTTIIREREGVWQVDLVSADSRAVTLLVGGDRREIAWPALRRAAEQEDEGLREIHRTILRHAEAAVRESERRRSVSACPRHVASTTGPEWCYRGGVAVAPYTDENRAAHGNVGVTETCACGAMRDVLINGRHTETGVWG